MDAAWIVLSSLAGNLKSPHDLDRFCHREVWHRAANLVQAWTVARTVSQSAIVGLVGASPRTVLSLALCPSGCIGRIAKAQAKSLDLMQRPMNRLHGPTLDCADKLHPAQAVPR